ncbi:MAG: hypothetical protein JWQ88_2481 [Rhodoferax sp.]|nr:hypothetical protein [Rhodoferax sp.]
MNLPEPTVSTTRASLQASVDASVVSSPIASPTPRPPVLVSILNWNGLADTLVCLASLRSDGEAQFDTVVIDNGSTVDESVEIGRLFPRVECIRLADNKGFAGGQNHGMALAMERGYEAVLLLNNDCEMSSADVDALWHSLQADATLAAVSPLIYWLHDRQRPQMVGGWIDWAEHTARRPSLPGVAKPAGAPTLLNGTALLLRCASLEKIGLLDEGYFAYYEDNDLSARLAVHGMGAAYCPNSMAYHHQRPADQYSAFALYLSARNAWTFWRRHTPAEHRKSLFRHVLAQNLMEITLLKRAGETAKCHAVVAGFWDAQRHRTGVPPKAFRSPFLLRWAMVAAPYLLYQLVRSPGDLVRAKWGALAARVR